MENLYNHYFLQSVERQETWNARSLDLAEKLQHIFDDYPITVIYIEPVESWNELIPTATKGRWKYHAICELYGKVHCKWIDRPMDLDDYLQLMFPGQQLMITTNNGELNEQQQYWSGGLRHA